jgi:hypothetical protein
MFHETTRQYTFFSVATGTFTKIDHILRHKASLSKYKKIEITPCILSDHNALKLEHYKQKNKQTKKKSRKPTNIWRLNNTLLKDQ